jgi:polyisoprenoid-binding protein YceI
MFMTRCLLVTAALLFGPASIAVAQERYDLDEGHTEITFGVKHFGLSTVKGRFTKVKGTILYDATDVAKSKVDVLITVTSLDSHNGKRDDALLSPQFLDAARYPVIGFKSTAIRQSGAEVLMVGDLTIRGVTRSVEMPVEFVKPFRAPHNNGALTLGAATSLVIDRRDFGLTFDQVMDGNIPFVGNDVKIDINMQAIRK